MRFENPWMLLLLVLVPLLFVVVRRTAKPAAVDFPSIGALGAMRPTLMTRLRQAMPYLRLRAVLLCVVAVARPQWGQQVTRIYRDGIAIVMVVDVSSSMGALDLQIGDKPANRLDMVKQTFKGFVEGEEDRAEDGTQGREGDMIGMVTFARFSDNLSPLTLDHQALLSAIDEVKIMELPEEDGTAIGDAVVMGAELLQRAGAQSRVMILLTDGSNNAGNSDPAQAAEVARTFGIKMYTIGTGTLGTAMTPVRQNDGTDVLIPTQVFIDEQVLTMMAETTGGKYFRATDGEALKAIYAEIDELEKSTNVAEQYQRYLEGFPFLLLAALALLLFEGVMVNTRLRALP
jgi:Ca-activated chloride channel family protein